MDPDPYKQEMGGVRLINKREHHWRMLFEDNYGGVGDKKSIIYAKRWDFYINKKKYLNKRGCSVEV